MVLSIMLFSQQATSFLRLLIVLVTSGLLGGLISFFVNFKNLPLPVNDSPNLKKIVDETSTESYFSKVWNFLSNHWELVAYLTIGIAGSLLLPVIYEILGGLKGLPGNDAINNPFSPWQYLVLFGYGTIMAYGSNRFFKSILDVILNRLSTNSQKSLAAPIMPKSLVGEKSPNLPEQNVKASGPFKNKILRDTPEFNTLVTNTNSNVIYKDEEKTGADQIMTPKLSSAVDYLANLVMQKWNGQVKLRITESWDENNEHSNNSLHYEARAADMTTSDLDKSKLSTLFDLAKTAGFDWVWYEDETHIHASVKA